MIEDDRLERVVGMHFWFQKAEACAVVNLHITPVWFLNIIQQC